MLFRSAESSVDYSARFLRASGANGGFTITNSGTGNLAYLLGGSFRFVQRGSDGRVQWNSYTELLLTQELVRY